MPLEAVLFDMDGTLVDTEPYWIEAEYALVESYGGTWSDEHAHNLVGNALIDSAIYIRDVANLPLEPAEIVERMLDHVVTATEREIPWQPGARELLAECVRNGIPCAMVTMSYERLTKAVVAQLPPNSLATVVSGDQVTHGKPHPEAYLTACERLGVEPRDTVAIEDSTTGLTSAEGAGCHTLGVPNRVPIPPAPGRTIVDSLVGVSLADLRALVTR